MADILKGEIIQDAYSQATISGLTRAPTPEDLDLALATADDLGLTLPFTQQTRDVMRMAVAMGRDEIDHSGLMTVIETMNGLDVPKRYAGKKRKS